MTNSAKIDVRTSTNRDLTNLQKIGMVDKGKNLNKSIRCVTMSIEKLRERASLCLCPQAVLWWVSEEAK